MQPYFMPYIGYFQLMKAVDKYVIYDDVNYINRGWINRNNLLVNGTKKLFTLSLQGASQNRLINEIVIIDDFRKLERTIAFNYSKAPFYKEVKALLDTIFSYPERQLALFIKNSFEQTLSYLSVHTELLLSSHIEKDNRLRGEDKIIDICKRLDADVYCNAIGGQTLYNKVLFAKNGIDLRFLRTSESLCYDQHLRDGFVPNLSLIDVLMFNSPSEVNALLEQYQFIQ